MQRTIYLCYLITRFCTSNQNLLLSLKVIRHRDRYHIVLTHDVLSDFILSHVQRSSRAVYIFLHVTNVDFLNLFTSTTLMIIHLIIIALILLRTSSPLCIKLLLRLQSQAFYGVRCIHGIDWLSIRVGLIFLAGLK